ncbi:methylated-DNA--[protein]-cysteine S-methyltransferase [Agrococcus jejuensis]|uniref:Methylated-DNA--protein-cysteine methyltransferase n=1 Tax=Agrococcus jejuensis TaxID=399736 RepID=A0A1G8ES60_9MICO|nr:methylated-DNA--[protein]-cysteine S-methyltransferase [Agrococcus jejuensis]SDH72705.1 methylated-DNA-[protein]-cysteine S-methyltransferase [Agrococcus jejuensis]
MTDTKHAIVDTPVGAITIVAGAAGIQGLYYAEHRPAPDEAGFGDRDDAALADAAEQLRAYFAGERTTFDLALDPVGTPFQLRVWEALREIPYGETRTYGWIAERIGQPTAVRAVGLANSRNPISIVVPCHRVVGSTGKLTGYAGGLVCKRTLLDLESGALLDVVARESIA